MRELYIFCEGSTEQGFCSQVLSKHLFPQCDGCIHTIRVAHSRHHGIVRRGGIGKYAALKRDIQSTLKSRREPHVSFTSLIDLYGLPADFPGKDSNIRVPNNPVKYVEALETAFYTDIGDIRFIPHLQLHEFETMLFTDPTAFRIAFDECEGAIELLAKIVASVKTIEEINDDYETCPSRRIIKALPAYEGRKASAGPDIAEFIGVSAIRAKCSHFGKWLARLESLNGGS